MFADSKTGKKNAQNNLWAYCASLGWRRSKGANLRCVEMMSRVLRRSEDYPNMESETEN